MEHGRVETPEIQTELERARNRAQVLGQVMATLSESRSLRATMKSMLAAATDLVWASAAAVYLRPKEGNDLVLYDSHGAEMVGSVQGALDLVTSAAGHVLASGAPQEFADTSAAPELRFLRFFDGSLPRSLYAVPIIAYEGSLGVLEVYSRTTRSLEPDESSLVVALAASAGIAITNARLYDAQVRARQEAEQHARVMTEQAARLHATLGAMADGVWICNRAGIVVSVNDAGLHMFGLRRSDIVDQPVAVLGDLFEVGPGEHRRLGLTFALQGETVHSECNMRLHHTGDNLIVDVRSTPIRDDTGAVIGAVAVVRDVTEAKAMDRLQEGFLSVAAHELKTPITALKGYTQLALRRAPPIAEMHSTRRALMTIDQQADRITRLVQKLLDVSRIQSGRLELQMATFDLQELIAGVAGRARLIAPSHQIEVEPHSPLMVTADYERLEQVLLNLIDNAIKYSAPGETIRLATSIQNDEARVGVHDLGVGIPGDKLPHIFDRWFQAHYGTYGDYGGMGLGLYICKEIIEQHGGHMWAMSSTTAGTTIGFALPLSSGELP